MRTRKQQNDRQQKKEDESVDTDKDQGSLQKEQVKSSFKNESKKILSKRVAEQTNYNAIKSDNLKRTSRISRKNQRKSGKKQPNKNETQESSSNKGQIKSKKKQAEKNEAEEFPTNANKSKFKNQGQKKKQKQPKKRSKSYFKKQRKIEKQKQAESLARQILQNIDESYEKDRKLVQKGKSAMHKVICIEEVTKKLKQLSVAKYFIEVGGPALFAKWLLKDPESGQQTCLTVKLGVFRLILDLHLSKQESEDSQELFQIIRGYRKSRFAELRSLSKKIQENIKNSLAQQNINNDQ